MTKSILPKASEEEKPILVDIDIEYIISAKPLIEKLKKMEKEGENA